MRYSERGGLYLLGREASREKRHHCSCWLRSCLSHSAIQANKNILFFDCKSLRESQSIRKRSEQNINQRQERIKCSNLIIHFPLLSYLTCASSNIDKTIFALTILISHHHRHDYCSIANSSESAWSSSASPSSAFDSGTTACSRARTASASAQQESIDKHGSYEWLR